MTITSSNTVVTDEKTKTVTIRQELYTLQAGTFLPGYHHVVYATTVEVKKGFVNPECNLTVHAASVVVDSGGATIDVSGKDGAEHPEKKARSANTTRSGSYDGEKGDDGKAGNPGGAGGKVVIHAETIVGGPLTILSRGGKGSRGQDGGNGKEGAQPGTKADAERPKQVVVGRKWVEGIRSGGAFQDVYGDDKDAILKIGGDRWQASLHITRETPSGVPGGHGGHAGLAGVAGAGGDGGQIVVRSASPTSIATKPDYAGGAKAAPAAHGTPGKAGAGGLGAKCLYKTDVGGVKIDWSAYDADSRWDNLWNTKNSKSFWVSIDYFDKLGVDSAYIVWEGSYKKLKLRADSGQEGKQGGYGASGVASAPQIAAARDGAAGSFVTEVIDRGGSVYRDVPYPYLLMLQRSATGALLNRDSAGAATMLRWLMLMTAAHRHAGQEAPEDARNRKALYYEAEAALLTRDRDASAGNRAAWCVYKDIKLYSDFVEVSMGHVSRQEKNLTRYQRAQERSADRQRALDEAITEVRGHVVHLTGDLMTPGSIVYFVEKEKQLKGQISGLDVRLLDYKAALESMERLLQEEIDARIRKETEVSIWTVLEFTGMAVGLVMNFASAAGSIKGLVTSIKDFYKKELDLSTVGEIVKDGIWTRGFEAMSEEVKKLLETDEWKKAWKKVSKDTKAFIKSAVDFQGKIAAYEAIAKSRQVVSGVVLDSIDIQASVLIFDGAKLDLKTQRNEFEAFILKFFDEYEQAKVWKHLFTDFFDTADTRFDMLAHLADVQAERRKLEYQRSVYERNLVLLDEQTKKLQFDPNGFNADDVRTGLESSLNLALEQGLERIMDEGRAYTIWTLQPHAFPKVPGNLTAEILRSKFHEPLWEKIKTALSKNALPAHRDFSDTPFVWKREDYAQEFALLEKTGRMTLSVPADTKSNIYFHRLTDAKVFLRGAKVKPGSAFYCLLRHRGVSDFVDKQRTVVTCYQEPRTVEFSYVVEGEATQPKPNYQYDGAIKEPFDDKKDPARIRYSPFTTWEVEIIPNYTQDSRSRVYNEDIALDATQAIELRVSAFFENYRVPQGTRGGTQDA